MGVVAAFLEDCDRPRHRGKPDGKLFSRITNDRRVPTGADSEPPRWQSFGDQATLTKLGFTPTVLNQFKRIIAERSGAPASSSPKIVVSVHKDRSPTGVGSGVQVYHAEGQDTQETWPDLPVLRANKDALAKHERSMIFALTPTYTLSALAGSHVGRLLAGSPADNPIFGAGDLMEMFSTLRRDC